MLPVERHGAVSEETSDDRDRLGEAFDPQVGTIESHAGLLVLRPAPARTNAELESAIGKEIQSRSLFGEHDGMPEVIGKHTGDQP